MGRKRLPKTPTLLLGASALLLIGTPVLAQTNTAQDNNRATEDYGITPRELGEFHQFLQSHPDIASTVQKQPWEATNYNYLQDHPALKDFLDSHPGVRQSLGNDPTAFMQQEQAASQPGDRRDVAEFDRFLDNHREIAEQVRKDPSLATNYNFLQSHPALNTFLQEHPNLRQQLGQNPSEFMAQEGADENGEAARGDNDARPSNNNTAANRDNGRGNGDYDRGRDNDRDRRDVAEFNRFLDDHREIGEQVRRDPSLADNRQFVQNHPALQTFLQNNPGVSNQLKQDPNAFVRQADQLNRAEFADNRDPMHNHMADFHDFLDNHRDIQKDVNRDPNCVKDQDYMHKHPELNAYLDSHPDVRTDLMADPQNFVKGAQASTSGSGSAKGSGSASGNGSGTTSGSTTGTTGMSTSPTGTHNVTGTGAGTSANTTTNTETKTK